MMSDIMEQSSPEDFPDMYDSQENVLVENLSAETFSDVLRKACKDVQCSLKMDGVDAQCNNSLHVLQGFVLSSSYKLSLDETKMVLDLVLCACAKIDNLSTVRQVCSFLNEWLTKENVWNLINYDAQFQPYVVVIGQRLYTLGDYETQLQLLETMVRIAGSRKVKQRLAENWFYDSEAVSMFQCIEPQEFEIQSRSFLNYINSSSRGQTVFSFIAQSVLWGSMELKKPHGLDLWIDFNYHSKSLSFYCFNSPQGSNNDDQDSDSALSMWDTFMICAQHVQSCSVSANEDRSRQYLVIKVNEDWLNYSQPMSYPNCGQQFCFEFMDIPDLVAHVGEIYGNLFHVEEDGHAQSNIHDTSIYMSQTSTQGNISRKRKASCAYVCIQSFVTEVNTPQTNESMESSEASCGGIKSYDDVKTLSNPLFQETARKGSDMELTPNVVSQDAYSICKSSFSKIQWSRAENLESQPKAMEVNLISEDENSDNSHGDVELKVSFENEVPVASSNEVDHVTSPIASVEKNVTNKSIELMAGELEFENRGIFQNHIPGSSSSVMLDNRDTVYGAELNALLSSPKILMEVVDLNANDTAPVVSVQGNETDHSSNSAELECNRPSKNAPIAKGRGSKKILLYKSQEAVMISISPELSHSPQPNPKPLPAETKSGVAANSANRRGRRKYNRKSTPKQLQKNPPKSASVANEEIHKALPCDSIAEIQAKTSQLLDENQEQDEVGLTELQEVAAAAKPLGDIGPKPSGEKTSALDIENNEVRTSEPSKRNDSVSDFTLKIKSGRKAAQLSTIRTRGMLKSKTEDKNVESISSLEIDMSDDKSSFSSPFLRKRETVKLGNVTSIEKSPASTKKTEDFLFGTPPKSYSKRKPASKKKVQTTPRKSTTKKKVKKTYSSEKFEKQFPSDISSVEKFQLMVEKTAKEAAYSSEYSTPTVAVRKKKIRGSPLVLQDSEPKQSSWEGLPEANDINCDVVPPNNIATAGSKRKRHSQTDVSNVLSSKKIGSLKNRKTSHKKTKPVVSPNAPSLGHNSHENLKTMEFPVEETIGHVNVEPLEPSMVPNGKFDHLKRFLEDFSYNEDKLSYDQGKSPNNSSDDAASDADSTTPQVYCSSSSHQLFSDPQVQFIEEEASIPKMELTDSYIGGRKKVRKKNKRIHKLNKSFNKILEKYVDVSSSSSECSCNYFCCETPHERDEYISPLFFEEAASLLRRFIATIQSFISDFFDKLNDGRRTFFHSICCADFGESDVRRNIRAYETLNAQYRMKTMEWLSEVKQTLNSYIDIEKEFEYSLMNIWTKAVKKYRRDMRETVQKALQQQETDIIKGLTKRLGKITRKFVRKGTL